MATFSQERETLCQICSYISRSCLPPAWSGMNERITKGVDARLLMWQACGEQACTKFVGYGQANSASLTELLASFFVLYHTAVQRWSRERSTGLRYMPPLQSTVHHQIHRLRHSACWQYIRSCPLTQQRLGCVQGAQHYPACYSQAHCITACLSVTD